MTDDTIRSLAIEAVAAMQRRDLPDPEWRDAVNAALDRLIEAAGSGEGMMLALEEVEMTTTEEGR